MIERLVRRLDIDSLSGVFEIELHDGTLHRLRSTTNKSESLFETAKDFIHTSYDTLERTLTLVAPNGEAFELEVFDGSNESVRRAGRPVVYLDQNKWISLARAIYSPKHVMPQSDLAPALKLIELAELRRVILPVSSGNMLEVAYTDGSWRRNVGRLMLRLSRGWLMTHPLITRRAELWSVLSPSEANANRRRDVFTLDPSRFYDPPYEDDEPVSRPREKWSDFERLFVQTLSGVGALFATLILEERLREESGEEAAMEWARTWQSYAEILRVNRRARANARLMTRVWFLLDLWSDYLRVATAAGRTTAELNQWFDERAESDLAQLPYLGRMREVLHARVMNAGDQWKPGDLVDMLYLPYAAGYADFVVAEKKTTHYLKQIQKKLGGGAQVMSSFAEAVEALDVVGASFPSTPA